MKTINWNKREILHIETPNGIVNIRCGLQDMKGRSVDSVELIPDGYAGENKAITVPRVHNVRMIRLKTVKA